MKLMMKVSLASYSSLNSIYSLIGILMLFACAGLKSISRCFKLTSLKLGICLNITDEGLGHVGMCCSKLIELDLYRFVIHN